MKSSGLMFVPRIIDSHAMMTSSNGNIFRVTGHLCREFTGPGEFPTQRPVTRSFDVYFDLRPDKRSSKQLWGWWFETLLHSLWRHRNAFSNRAVFMQVWATPHAARISQECSTNLTINSVLWPSIPLRTYGQIYQVICGMTPSPWNAAEHCAAFKVNGRMGVHTTINCERSTPTYDNI